MKIFFACLKNSFFCWAVSLIANSASVFAFPRLRVSSLLLFSLFSIFLHLSVLGVVPLGSVNGTICLDLDMPSCYSQRHLLVFCHRNLSLRCFLSSAACYCLDCRFGASDSEEDCRVPAGPRRLGLLTHPRCVA